jgi:hypothetical protein
MGDSRLGWYLARERIKAQGIVSEMAIVESGQQSETKTLTGRCSEYANDSNGGWCIYSSGNGQNSK